MELLRFLKPLEEFEYTLSRLYHYFAYIFIKDDDAFQLFSTLEEEEIGHQELIRSLRNLVLKNYRDYGEVHENIRQVIELTQFILQYIESKPDVTLEKALGIALNFEKTAAERHYRTAIIQSNPVLEDLVRNLSKADEVHVSRLRTFMINRGYLSTDDSLDHDTEQPNEATSD